MSDSSNKTILLTENDLYRIKDFAKRRFDEFRAPPPLSTLIIMGLHDFLKSKGIEPQFEVKHDPN